MTDTDDLAARTDALVAAADLADGRADPGAVEHARSTAEQLRGRLTHGTDHTVVALAGPTGSGKSSLFNALVGAPAAAVGVTRPTTDRPQAAVFGAGVDPAGVGTIDGLLDWLEVRDRHIVADPPSGLDGLVLLDLPDFDSTTVEHRVEVDRLISLVDMLVWIMEPQKYADESLHIGYLRRLHEHASIQRFVLSKVDLLGTADRDTVIGDLGRRLDEDGLPEASVWPVSTTDGSGLEDLRSGLADAVRDRTAIVERLDADLRVAAEPLAVGTAAEPTSVSRDDRRALAAALAEAAGVSLVADAVAHDHRRAARRATGWPVVRWIRRRRPARLAGRRLVDGSDPIVESAAVGAALRAMAEAVGDPIGPPWGRALRRETLARRDEVATALAGRVLAAARDSGRAPAWWWLTAQLQNLALLIAAVGAAWLVMLVALGALRLGTEALVPMVGIFPLPTLLLGGGLLAGWLISLSARVPARVAARRRARRAKRRMNDVVADVAGEDVIAGIEAILAERAEIARLATIAAGT